MREIKSYSLHRLSVFKRFAHSSTLLKNPESTFYPVVYQKNISYGNCNVVKCLLKEAFLYDESTFIKRAIDSFPGIDGDLESVTYSGNRLNVFLGGRIALRHGLNNIYGLNTSSLPSNTIRRNEFGAPVINDHLTGSISHKDHFAVGIIQSQEYGEIGIDLERANHKSANRLQWKVLSSNERNSISSKITSAEADIMTRFSFKEAAFKALHRYLQRSIGFNEVEIYPNEDGTANVQLHLKSLDRFTSCVGHWEHIVLDNQLYVLTTVIVQR
jgi:phosphopantetheine--protein transferase-like protein